MRLTVLATSDVHGYVWPQDDLSDEVKPYGLARVATYIKQKRAAEHSVIAIDNGDLLQGAAFTSYLMANRDSWSVHPLVQCLNELQYDAAVPGNHEFNYGMDYLNACVAGMDFPYVSANVLGMDGKPYWEPYAIVERNGVTIGIIGLTTSYVPRWERAENIDGLSFMDPVKEGQYWAKIVREQADIVILAYHGGIERDMQTGDPTEYATGENVGYRLATEIPEIDALITGHQHRVMVGKCQGIPYIQPGKRGEYVAEITFELEKRQGKWQIVETGCWLNEMQDVEPDQAIMTGMSDWLGRKEAWLDMPLEKVYDQFEGDGEHPYVSFLHRLQTTVSGVSISAISFLNIREDGFDDAITMRHIIANYAFPNTLAVMRVSGKDLREALEKSASFFHLNEAGRLTVYPASTPLTRQNDYFDMYTGIDYTLEGNRVTKLIRNGKIIRDDDTLEIVVNNYRVPINGGYPVFGSEKIIREIMLPTTDLVAVYATEQKAVVCATYSCLVTVY